VVYTCINFNDDHDAVAVPVETLPHADDLAENLLQMAEGKTKVVAGTLHKMVVEDKMAVLVDNPHKTVATDNMAEGIPLQMEAVAADK
jgi:hypothetical protein